MIEETTVVNKNSRTAFRIISGQAVLVQPINETMLTLNETGTVIWQQLDGQTVGEIAKIICDQFEVDTDTALADTIEFLSVLTAKDLATIAQ